MRTCWQAQRQLDQRWPPERHNEELAVEGFIASLPEQKLQAGDNGAPSVTWRFLLEPRGPQLPRRVRVAWYLAGKAALTPPPALQAVPPSPASGRGAVESLRDDQVRGGECWRFTLRLKTPHGSLNPGGFDYEAWLFRQGVGATATVRSAGRCEAEGFYPVLKLRQRLVRALEAWLPGHPANGLIAALVVGDTSALKDADWDVFRLTGTSHLVAISGFNIAIVAGAAFFLLRWLWSLWPALCLRLPAQKAGMLGSALVAAFYTLLAGFEPPVLRALLMLLFLLAAAWMNRLSQPSRVLALAWLAILLADPFAVMSPGLWLSFGAVGAIFHVSQNRLRPLSAGAAALLIQLMLSVALAPLTLYFFHGASWAGPLVNLVAVPLFALLTPVLLAAVLAALAWPALGVPLLGVNAEILLHIRQALDAIAAVPGLWLAASPPPSALALALLGVVLLFAPRGLPLKLPALLCLLPLAFPPGTAPREGFALTALDVGQGLSVVVRTAGHALLYDTGPAFDEGFDAGESVVAPYLLSQGVRDLDLMMISHADNDHSGGAPALRRLVRVIDERGALTAHACHEGERWDWDGVHFELLHPDTAQWSENNGGCVLRVSAGTHAALLPADIEKGAEQRLVRDDGALLRAEVLLAPHHGSKTSSTAEFIEAVQPKLVIYSAGWRHHFHHPHPAVVQRYAQAGAQQFDTGMQGALSLRVTDSGISDVNEYRAGAAHWWNAAAEQIQP